MGGKGGEGRPPPRMCRKEEVADGGREIAKEREKSARESTVLRKWAREEGKVRVGGLGLSLSPPSLPLLRLPLTSNCGEGEEGLKVTRSKGKEVGGRTRLSVPGRKITTCPCTHDQVQTAAKNTETVLLQHQAGLPYSGGRRRRAPSGEIIGREWAILLHRSKRASGTGW